MNPSPYPSNDEYETQPSAIWDHEKDLTPSTPRHHPAQDYWLFITFGFLLLLQPLSVLAAGILRICCRDATPDSFIADLIYLVVVSVLASTVALKSMDWLLERERLIPAGLIGSMAILIILWRVCLLLMRVFA